MIRIIDVAREGGWIIYTIEFDDDEGQLHHIPVRFRAYRFPPEEEYLRDRIVKAVERTRAELVMSKAMKFVGLELEPVESETA